MLCLGPVCISLPLPHAYYIYGRPICYTIVSNSSFAERKVRVNNSSSTSVYDLGIGTFSSHMSSCNVKPKLYRTGPNLLNNDHKYWRHRRSHFSDQRDETSKHALYCVLTVGGDSRFIPDGPKITDANIIWREQIMGANCQIHVSLGHIGEEGNTQREFSNKQVMKNTIAGERGLACFATLRTRPPCSLN